MAMQKSSASTNKVDGTGVRVIERLPLLQATSKSSAPHSKHCRRMIWRKLGNSRTIWEQAVLQSYGYRQRRFGEARAKIGFGMVLQLLMGCGMIWRSEKRRLLGVQFECPRAAATSCLRSGTPKASAPINQLTTVTNGTKWPLISHLIVLPLVHLFRIYLRLNGRLGEPRKAFVASN